MSFGDGLKPFVKCRVCFFIASQPDPAKAAAFFSDDSYTHIELAQEMAANGCPISETAVRRHRINHMGVRVSELR